MNVSDLAPEHERLLQRLVTGEAAETDADVQHALATAPGLRAAWTQLRDASAALDQAGHHGREILADSSDVEASDVDALERQLEQHLRALAPSARPGLRVARRQLWLGAAAAAVLALVWWLPRQDDGAPSPGPGPTVLGPLTPGELWPNEQASDYAWFRWNLERPEQGRFSVSVCDGDGRVLLGPIEIVENELRPGAAADRWPAAGVELRVTVLGPGGGVVVTHTAWTWRTPR